MQTHTLDPANQSHWPEIIDSSRYTTDAVSQKLNVTKQTLSAWLNKKAPRKPRREQEVVSAMAELLNKPRLEKHPSYGWARPDQIQRLNEIGIGPERDRIMKAIDKQNKAKGKVK